MDVAALNAELRRKPSIPFIQLYDPYNPTPAEAPAQEQQPPRAIPFDPNAVISQPQQDFNSPQNDVFLKFLEEKGIDPNEYNKWVNGLIPSRKVK